MDPAANEGTGQAGGALAGDGQQPPAGQSLLTGAGVEGGQQRQAGQAQGDGQAQGQQGATGEGSGEGGQQTGAAEFDPAKLTVPDGVEKLDQALIDQFAPVAKEMKLNQEQAQQLVNLYAGAASQSHQQLQAAFEAQVKQWGEETRADPEIGGAKLQETLHYAQKAVRTFGGEPLAKTLDDLGIGNHPVLVKAFAQIGRQISGESLPGGGSPPAPEKTRAEILFGGDKAA